MKSEVEYDSQESEYERESPGDRSDEPSSLKGERAWMVCKILLILLMILSLLLLAEVNFFTVEKVEVEGNTIYSDETVSEALVSGSGSWNTLYVWLKYKLSRPEQMAFVEQLEIRMKGIHTLSLSVTEKKMSGYVSDGNDNVYFDRDGNVAEISETVLEGIPKVTGLSLNAVSLSEKLPVSGSILTGLLRLTGFLEEYEMTPDTINCKSTGDMTISFGKTKVNIGQADGLEMKLRALQSIYPSVEGKKGTLDLSDYSETNTDIIFKKSY